MVSFKCKMCGYCCTRYWIPITHLDMLRLVIYGNVEVSNAIELKNAKIYHSKKFPKIKLRRGEYYLALREKKGSSSCIFLTDDGRCSVHEYKPLTCRFYPFVYIVQKDGTIKISINEKAINECPGIILDNKPVDRDIVNSLTRLARVRLIELDLYRNLVNEWNSELNGPFSRARDFIEYALDMAKRHKKNLEEKGMWIK